MWNGRTVSVILMTYVERDSIREVVEGFFATGVVDEVVVVNNNAEAGTGEEVAKTNARQVFEPRQGYGYATQRGLAEATGDLIVVAEPDGTFLPSDIVKLLVYSDDCDAVFGTRTTRELIWRGANMGWFLKWGNWAVAKLVEVLFNTSHLSDVGCSYRLLHRDLARRLEPHFTVGGSHFGPELMLLAIASGARMVEVPVNYLPRVGVSSSTGDLRKAVILGLRMILFILRFRLATFGRARFPAANAGSSSAIRPERETPREQSDAQPLDGRIAAPSPWKVPAHRAGRARAEGADQLRHDR